MGRILLNRPEMVLFDLDGTLVDSAPDLAWCIDNMLIQMNRPVSGEGSVRLWVGNGIERLVKRALVNSLDGEPDSTLFNEALAIFESLYLKNTSNRSQLYKGVREFLEFLKLSAVSIGCVTNKAVQFTNPLLQGLKIDHYFETVVCGDMVKRKKPDPLPLLTAAKSLAVSPSVSLMIGDSVSDVEAARKAGFDIVCMSYGYNHGKDIRLARPDAVIDSMTELKNIICW